MLNIKKNLYTLKQSLIIFKKIRYFSLKNALFLLPKIISSQYWMYNNDYNEIRLNKKKYFDEKYTFNFSDWFSKHILVWEKFLSKKKEISYLEIGSFEGRSALFILELGIAYKITCVDALLDNPLLENFKKEIIPIDYSVAYTNLQNNLRKSANNKCLIKIIKDKSDNFFLSNIEQYDVIYIDGSHFYEDVKNDFKNSLKFLKKGGLLICDDFLWNFYNDANDNPTKAILECYENYKSYLNVKFVNYQIFFKKIK